MPKIKSILILIDSLGSGGSQRQAVETSIALNEKGINVELFYYYPFDFYKKNLDEKQIKIHFYPKSKKFEIKVLLELVKIVKSSKYDCIISFLETPSFYNVLIKKLVGHICKTIVSYRSTTNLKKLSFLNRKKLEWTNYYCDFIIFNSYHEKENWIDYYGYLKPKSFTIYNIVNTSKYKPINQVPIKKFLFVGKLRPDKNIELLIDAIYLLKTKYGREAQINCFGETIVPMYKNYFNKVRIQIKELGVEHLLTWNGMEDKMENVYPQYYALIHPSQKEGLPNAVCEALSCGVPVLASNILDNPNLIEDGKRGFLFGQNDKNKLAELILNMLNMEAKEYVKLQKNCRNFAKIAFAKKTNIENLIQIIS